MNSANSRPTDGRSIRIAVVTDAVYARGATRTISLDGVNGDQQWSRYRAPGLEYRIFGRLRSERESELGAPLEEFELVPLPDYTGLVQGLRKYRQIRKQVGWALKEQDGVILRMPGLIAVLVYPQLRRHRLPYVVEVVGDIADLYANSEGVLARLQRPIITRIVKRIVRNASAARYVTQSALQRVYPSRGPMFGISNVQVSDELFVPLPRKLAGEVERYRLLCVGTQEHDYKGHDTAIEALKLLVESGVDAELTLVGAGRLSDDLKEWADRLGVADRTNFVGQLPRTAVFEQYQSHHLLLQPSRTEGLPRTVIEAMSQALPVVGSNVSGLPELLNADYVVRPNDPALLADRIRAILLPEVWESESERSLREAKRYRYSILSEQFREWIEVVRKSVS